MRKTTAGFGLLCLLSCVLGGLGLAQDRPAAPSTPAPETPAVAPARPASGVQSPNAPAAPPEPASVASPASPAPPGANEAAPVALTVPQGVPLHLSLTRKVPIKQAGVAVEGQVVEPVYVFDHLVIPAGSRVTG